ncbi:hypothetical protein [Desulfatibacillum aliphaticivorans]|uniref:hypothetical protein n=1 Tax=Desulfatibacillum aliphaticivorans TaxID=218208 RepID=UPI0004117F30|nr:hypothetical protein [Desulfatibacillum aliphaticivorans]
MLKRVPITGLLVCCLVHLCLITPSFAQEKVNSILPFPTANSLFDSWTPDGSTFYFVGDSGTIIKYDGTNFEFMDSPTNVPLFCIHGTSETDIWAAGGDDYSTNNLEKAVFLHYDGSTWSSVPAPVFLGSDTYPPDDIHAIAPDNVWAADERSAYLYHWDGNSWSVDYVSGLYLGVGLDSVHAFAADDVYAVGWYGQIIHYDGSAWTIQKQEGEPPFNFSTNFLDDVWGPDADTVFACGNYGQVYKLNKAAGNWIEISNPITYTVPVSMQNTQLTSISGTSGSDMYFTSYSGSVYHWNGSGFTEIPPSEYWKQNVIRQKSDGSYLIAGDNGRLETYSPVNGWREESRIPTVKKDFTRVSWGEDLWFAPGWINSGEGVFAWNKGSMTEHPLPIGENKQAHVTGLRAFAKDNVWVGLQPMDGSYSYGAFHYDGESWTSWKPNNAGVPLAMTDVLYTESGDMFIILGGLDGGLPRKIVNGDQVDGYNDPDFDSYYSLAQGSDGKVYAVGQNGKIISYSGGAWTEEDSGVTTKLASVAAGDGYVYAVGGSVAIYKMDGGAWTPVSAQGIYSYDTFSMVSYLGAGKFIASLNTYSGYIGGDRGYLYQFENGQATLIDGWMSQNLCGVVATDSGQWYASGDGAVVLSSGVIQKGDIDMNASLDVGDAIVSLQLPGMSAGSFSRADWAFEATDPDGDDKVTVKDTLFVLQRIAGVRD